MLSSGTSFALPDAGQPARGGQAVTLGIRPEHLNVVTNGDNVIDLAVDVIEELGADTIVHGRFDGETSTLTVRLRGARTVRAGKSLLLTVEAEHLHLFDGVTGRRLGSA